MAQLHEPGLYKHHHGPQLQIEETTWDDLDAIGYLTPAISGGPK